MPLLGAIAPPVGDGLGSAFCRGLSRAGVVIACALAVGIACVRWRGLAMVAASAALVFLARAYFVRRIGGVNGDCLGATCQVVEIANLLILAWRPSI
jgi:adenosylcobinamide-GDP ribazoletransferase